MSKLKKCPHCEDEAALETMQVRKGWEADVHCNGCPACIHTITYDTEAEAIDADALISDIDTTIENSGCVNHEGEILDCIAYADTIDAVPVVRGEWTKRSSGLIETLALCSKCSYPISWRHKTNFCPNCGAKMEVEHDG